MVYRCVFLLLLAFSGEAFSKIKLEEGKNFIFERDTRGLFSTVNLIFRSGSIHDFKGKEGLAELSFRSILRGTKRKDREAFALAIEALGATISIDTSPRRTILTLDAITENLEPAIGLLAEALLEPAFPKKDIQALFREHLATLNQARSRTVGMLFRAFRQVLYRNTPLAHSPDGTIQSVKSIKREDLSAFLAKHVVDQNMLFAVSTGVAEASVRKWLEKAFQKTPKGRRPKPWSQPLPTLKGRHVVIYPQKGVSTINTIIGHPSVPSTFPQMLSLEVGNFVFGRAPMTNRLFQELRNKTGWTYGASSSFHYVGIPRYYGSTFTLFTFPQKAHARKAISKAIRLYEAYSQKGIKEEEYKHALRSLYNSYPFRFVSSKSRMNRKIYELLDGTPDWSVEEYRKRLYALDLKELNKVIGQVHTGNDFILALAGNHKELRRWVQAIPGIESIQIVTDPIEKVW